MERLAELLKRIRLDGQRFVVQSVGKDRDPFKLLVAIILSQNTSDNNAIKAYRLLEEKIGVEPGKLAEANQKAVEEALRPAGMYRRRAWVLRNLARIVLDKYRGDLSRLLGEDWRKVREELLRIPGIGVKTADVFIANLFPDAEVMPIDTHIRRVSRRLGIVGDNASYEETSHRLIEVLKGRINLLEAHLKLIAVGRKYCRPRKPRCRECPLREVCRYARETGAPNNKSQGKRG